ncbi:hypothetical protein BJ170DRAFT_590827 [Xylariales sp. AK1849]|nr:hypothetical protein BJ170DRAFT_590827 [Xylariales sp. AK1849]
MSHGQTTLLSRRTSVRHEGLRFRILLDSSLSGYATALFEGMRRSTNQCRLEVSRRQLYHTAGPSFGSLPNSLASMGKRGLDNNGRSCCCILASCWTVVTFSNSHITVLKSCCNHVSQLTFSPRRSLSMRGVKQCFVANFREEGWTLIHQALPVMTIMYAAMARKVIYPAYVPPKLLLRSWHAQRGAQGSPAQ